MCPTYRFENTETGEIFEKWMLMADKDPYLKENTHMKPLILHNKGPSPEEINPFNIYYLL